MSTTVTTGALIDAANDFVNVGQTLASGEIFLSPTGYAKGAFTTFSAVLGIAGEIAAQSSRWE